MINCVSLDFFRGVLTPDKCDMIKSQIIQLLPQRTGFSPREILHCGDNVQDDIIPALAQSMNAVLIRRPSHYMEPLPDTNESFPVIQKLNEILIYL